MFKNAVDTIKPVTEKSVQAFYTDKFQLFDIIEVVLQQIKHCKVLRMTSFSISEEFTRKIFRFRQEYAIERIELYLDTKATEKTMKLKTFLLNTFDEIHLLPNHGKVILFDSNPLVSICTSQNQTRGNRRESHIITTNNEIYNSFMAELEEMKNISVKL